MAKNPKNQPPNDDQPGKGSDDSLPPWLRGDAPPPPDSEPAKPASKSSLPKLSPRKSDDPDDSVPPWLRGLDAPESKNVMIGGKEVPREFFDDADSLADAFETDQSYDDWLAAQNEEKREKSVEEEIPDIFAGLGPENDPEPAASPSAYPTPQIPGTTGQLPDWFLGLEELDDAEAPEWFKQMGTGPLSSTPEPPAPKKPEPAKADPIVDFFQNLGMDVEAEDDDLPVDLPGTGFFQNLVGKEAPPEAPRRAAPSRSQASDDDDVPDLGSVTGKLKPPPGFLQDDEDDNIFASPKGGATRRLDDEGEEDIFAALSGAGGKTRNLDFEDYETPAPPIQGGQTIRFDMQDDAPPAPAAGGQTIRFDNDDDELPLQGGQTIRFDDYDEPFDTPAPPIQGGQTIRFDMQDEEKLVPTDELDAFLAGIGEDPSATTPKPPAQIEIPQYELDAFLEGIDPPAPVHNTQEMASIEDPDLDFFMEAEQQSPEPQYELETFEPYEPEDAELDTGSLSFLNELDNIVANASRGGDPTSDPGESFEMPSAVQNQDYDDPDFDAAGNFVAAAPTTPRDAAPAGEFDWGDYEATPVEQAAEEPAEEDWLTSIGEQDAPYEAATTRIPSPEELGLTGLLNRGKKKEQPPPENYDGARQLSAPGAQPPAQQDDFNLDSLYATDAQESDAGLGSWQIPDSLSGGEAPAELSADLEDWERVVRGGSTGYEAPSPADYDDDDDLFASLSPDDPLESELQSGWLNDDVLKDAELFDQSSGTTGQAASAQSDFNLFDLSDVSLDDVPLRNQAQPAAAQDDFNLFDLSDVSLDDVPLRDQAQAAAPMQEDNFSFLDLADTPLDESELPASTDGTDDDFFSMLERDQGANILPRTSALTPPPVPQIENESDTLNFDELEPAMAQQPDSDFDDPDLFSFFDEEDDKPAAPTPPQGTTAPEGETIDFGKWDKPQENQPEAESEGIDFGKWDMPEAQTEGDSIDFGKWDMPAAQTEGDSIDFGKWDQPQAGMPEEWDESIGFGEWEMPGTGDLDPVTSQSSSSKATSDFDTIDFDNLESPAPNLEMPGTGDLGYDRFTSSAQSRDSDQGNRAIPDSGELDQFAFQQGTPDSDAGFDNPDFFAFLGETENPPLRVPPSAPSAAERKNESETIALDDQGQPVASEPAENWSFDVDDPDIFAFLGDAEGTPPLPGPTSYAPTPAERKYESDTIDVESLGPEAFQQAMSAANRPADTDPYKTISTRDSIVDQGPEPEHDAAHAQEAVTDNFFESFGLNDDSQQTRNTLDELEVEDIFASLDSEPLVADDDTQPQELVFDLQDDPNAAASESDLDALFSTWEASQSEQAEADIPAPADAENYDALFSTWDADASPTQMTMDSAPPAAQQQDGEDLEAEDLFSQWEAARSPEAAPQGNPDAVEPFDLFGDWGTEDIAPVQEQPDHLEGWQSDAPPPLEVPTTYTEKRATSSLPAVVPPDDDEPDLFAEWGMDQPDPFTDMTGLNEGVNWAEEFNDPPTPKKPGDKKEEDRNSFLENRENRTDSSKNRAGSPAFDDIDTYLASLGTDQPQISQQTGVMFNRPDNVDIDALLDQQVGGERESRRAGYVSPFGGDAEGIEGANPDFLEDISLGVEDVSAGAMVRQKQDRPVEELPERLRKLRERSAKLQAETRESVGSDDSLSDILPGIDVGLSQATFATGVTALDRSLNVTAEQQTRINLLQSLVGGIAEPKRMSAIEMTYDTPFMEDFQDDEENIVHPPTRTEEVPAAVAVRPRARRGLRLRIQPDRLLIVALLTAAVIAPFLIPSLRIGDPPPADFSADPAAAVAFAAVDTLGVNDLALVALEYAPASSGELDTMTGAILRHIFLRGASPVIIGGNPVTLLRAEGFVDNMNADADFITRIGVAQPLEQNFEYFVARFLPGGVIGLRAFSADTANLLASDIRGQTTNLFIDGLDDFDVIVVITDNGETLRAYAEQVAPLTGAPLVAGSTYGAAPLVEPYARTGNVAGILSGYGDGLTYAGLLDDVDAVQRPVRRIVTPPPTPIPPTLEAPALGTGDTNGAVGAGVEATAELTVTPEATEEASTTPQLPTAVINATQRVNLRAEPNGNILGGVEPGARVILLGSSDDGEWAQIRLANGTEGWVNIAAAQLEIETGGQPKRTAKLDPVEQIPDVEATNTPPRTRTPIPATASPSPTPSPINTTERTPSGASVTQEETVEDEATASPTPRPSTTPSPTRRPTSTPEPTSTRTDEPTEEATAEVIAPPSTPTPLVLSAGLQSERWYGINMGIIVSVLIISVGAFGNIVRSLLRGRRNR